MNFKSVNNLLMTLGFSETATTTLAPTTPPPTTTEAPINNTPGVADFDGVGDYLEVATTNELRLTGDFTVEAWVEFDGAADDVTIITKSQLNNFYDWELRTVDSGGAKLRGKRGATEITGATTLVTGQWYHVALSYDGTTTRLFLDGKLEGSTTTSTSQNGGSANVRLGGIYSHGNGTTINYLDGRIDKARITSMCRYTTDFAVPYDDAGYESGTDANFSDVELLLMMNGAQGSQVFPDSSNSDHSTTVSGAVFVNTNEAVTTTTTTTTTTTAAP
jgi:hypothetical protein